VGEGVVILRTQNNASQAMDARGSTDSREDVCPAKGLSTLFPANTQATDDSVQKCSLFVTSFAQNRLVMASLRFTR